MKLLSNVIQPAPGTNTIGVFTEGGLVLAGAGGVLAQDPTQLFWDSALKQLGVGTNVPQQKLDLRHGDAGYAPWLRLRNDSAANANLPGPGVLFSTGVSGVHDFLLNMRHSTGGELEICHGGDYTPYFRMAQGGTAAFGGLSPGNAGVLYVYGDKLNPGTNWSALQVTANYTFSAASTATVKGVNLSMSNDAVAANQGTFAGLQFSVTGNQLAGGTTAALYGVYGQIMTAAASTGNYTSIVGGRFLCQPAGSGTIATLKGGEAFAQLKASGGAAGGTVTQMFGFQAGIENSANNTTPGTVGTAVTLDAFTPTITAPITTLYGVRVQPHGSSFVTTTCGLAVGNVANSTNNTNILVGTTTVPSGQHNIYSNQGSLAANRPAFESLATWNSAEVHTHLSANVTDTASDHKSLLVDLVVTSSPRFQVEKSGRFTTPRRMCHVWDDFVGGNNTSGNLGQLGWTSNGTASVFTAVSSHPGLLRLDTTAVADTVSAVQLPGTGSRCFNPIDSFDLNWLGRVNSSGVGVTYRIGCGSGSVGTAQPTTGMYFEYVGGTDTNWQFVTRSADVETRTDTGVAVSTAWRRFRVRRVSSTVIGFAIDEGAETQVTTNIPSSVQNPWAMVTNPATAASKTLDLDYFDLVTRAMTRY